MNGLEQAGQWAGALYAGGLMGALAYAAALTVLVTGAVVLARGIATARRTRRRNGRQAPGPPPGQVPGVPMERAPLTEKERREFLEITRHLRMRAHVVTRRRGTVRRTRARTGNR